MSQTGLAGVCGLVQGPASNLSQFDRFGHLEGGPAQEVFHGVLDNSLAAVLENGA
ncbi:MAG: hypothetical protein LC126_11190 [Bryobacterales bacterium]|nr:hypothetical protein [Bryobacterales bacterium]